MFCGLNGATRTPRRRSTRQRPATSVLLPASEVVPCTIRVWKLKVCGCSTSADVTTRVTRYRHVSGPLRDLETSRDGGARDEPLEGAQHEGSRGPEAGLKRACNASRAS